MTDGSLGIGKGSLRHSLHTLKHRGDDKKFPLPFPFPAKLFILCVANPEEVLSHPVFISLIVSKFPTRSGSLEQLQDVAAIHFYLLHLESEPCKKFSKFSPKLYLANSSAVPVIAPPLSRSRESCRLTHASSHTCEEDTYSRQLVFFT